jgi:hypothetical protein
MIGMAGTMSDFVHGLNPVYGEPLIASIQRQQLSGEAPHSVHCPRSAAAIAVVVAILVACNKNCKGQPSEWEPDE